MSSESTTYRLTIPTDPARYLIAARVVFVFLFRAACLAFAVWLLAAIRSGTAIHTHIFFFIMAFGCVYIALGRTAFRPWAFYLGGFILFAQLRGFADGFASGVGLPIQFEYAIVAEKTLFLGEIPSIWLQDRLYTFARLGPVEFYTMFIYLSYFFIPHIVAFALWKWDKPRFKNFVGAFMITLYVGLLTSAVLPTAPPWMAGQLGHIGHVYQIVPDISGEVTPGAYENVYEIAGANPVAAMPSLHSAVPFVMALALWKYPWVRWLGLGYAVSMIFSVVYLGEHYVVDGLAGWGVAGAAWVGVRAYLARREEAEQAAEVKADVAPPVTEQAPQVTRG